MKKIILLILLSICIKSYSQINNSTSIELKFNTAYFSKIERYQNRFKYGFTIQTSKYINKFKIGVGFNYSLLTFNTGVDSLIKLQKKNYELKYIHIPILFYYNFLETKHIEAQGLIGLEFNHLQKYTIDYYYFDNTIFSKNVLLDESKLGKSLILGFCISKPIKKFKFNYEPTYRLQIVSDHYMQRPSGDNIPEFTRTLIFNFSIEYFIN